MEKRMMEFPTFTVPSELFAVGNAAKAVENDASAWPTAQHPVEDFNIDNFDTELNFDADMDLDLEKLCREILDEDSFGQVEQPEVVETVESFPTTSSRSNSESEGSGTCELDETPIQDSQISIPESPVAAAACEPVFFGNAVRARVIRIPNGTAIPIVVGKQGVVRDPTKTRICVIRRPSSEGSLVNATVVPTVSAIRTTQMNTVVPSSSRVVTTTPSYGGFVLDANSLADDCSIATDVSSPLSSDDRDDDHGSDDTVKPLILTAEEKKIADLENIILPDSYPLTREEERNLRRIRRKIRNKKSAQVSRKRKQLYVEDLEKRVKLCSEEKAMLQKRVSKLERENASLVSQLRNVQSAMTGLAGKAAPTSTAFLILVMSVAMLLAPNVKMSSKVDNLDKMLETPDSVRGSHLAGPGTSAPKRTLLADTRNMEPTSADTNKLEEFFKNLEAMKKQFSWIGETFSGVGGGESPAKRQKLDDSAEETAGSSNLDGRDDLLQGLAGMATFPSGKEGRVGVTTVLEPDSIGEANAVYVATNRSMNKIEALEY